MKKLKYFNTPFWSVAEAGEGGGGGMLTGTFTRHHVIHLFNNTKPLHIVQTQYNSRKRQILAENSPTKRDNSSSSVYWWTLWWGGQVCGGGGGRGTVWGDDHDRQVIPVSSILPQPLFCLHTTQQREITPAALYTGGSCITGGVTSMVMLCLPSIWVNNVNDHHKSCNFKKKMKKILNIWGVMAPCPVRRCMLQLHGTCCVYLQSESIHWPL